MNSKIREGNLKIQGGVCVRIEQRQLQCEDWGVSVTHTV
jgi:hypothetical protein